MSLTFDEPSHVYRWNGKVVPSVTQVLGALYSFADVPIDVLEAARERGTDVHLACQLDDEGDLNEATITEEVAPYLKAWRKFKHDCRPSFGAIEKPVYNAARRYAGTPDRDDVCFRFGAEMVTGAQIDIKTSLASHVCWGVQTAAYSNALGKPQQPRFTVQLRPDGDYRLLEWTDPADWPVFVSLLTLRTFKERHKL